MEHSHFGYTVGNGTQPLLATLWTTRHRIGNRIVAGCIKPCLPDPMSHLQRCLELLRLEVGQQPHLAVLRGREVIHSPYQIRAAQKEAKA